ncbi:hypothetical protein [Polluticoccus soli]|uniref:hypothetical protein n=1 Tax=Polluticoccus soli TaxID=3034150 RepID=UPI0023E13F99|nr:hypothetical protein [Flavipsychrobacter sp. JY13-12]
MSNDYKRLKEELDGTDLDSILPGFDREASWKELSPRLKKTQNKTFAWRYAAALVAIIIVALMVRIQMNKPNVNEQVAKTVPVATMPAAVDTHTAATQTKVEPIPEPITVVAAKKATTHKTAPVQKMVQPDSQPLPVEEHIANTQPDPVQPEVTDNVEQTVATVKPVIKRPKAIHLLDIDNENRQAVIQNRKELQGLSQRIVNLIPGRQYSNTDNDRKPSSLFRAN